MMGVFVLLAVLLQSVAPDLREGLMALNRGDLPAASASLQTAAKADPENPVVWAALAQVYLRTNHKPEALGAAETAERLGKENAAIQHALAMFYAGEGEPAKAAAFERRYAVATGADDAFARASQMSLDGGDLPGAIEIAQQGVRQADSAALHTVLARLYGAQKQTAKEREELTRALQLAPESEEISFALAEALLRSERFSEAAVALERFVNTFPSSAQLRLALGVAYYGLRKFPEAVDAFLKTIDLDPDVEQPYRFLGRMLDQAGNRQATIQARFEQFHLRHPENSVSALLLAKSLAASGGTADRIEPLFREALTKSPDDWEAHAGLADLLSNRRDYSGAAAEFEQSARLNSTEPSIPFRLARVYDRLHEPEKANAQRELHKRLLTAPQQGMAAQGGAAKQ